VTKESNFWRYIADKYGVQVSYSDSGWKIRYNRENFIDGEVGVGLLKHNMGLPQDSKRLNTYILGALAMIRNLLWVQFTDDEVLRQKYSQVKATALGRSRHG
jgi:hypothetical protein